MLNLLALLVLPAIILFLALTHRRKKLCGEQPNKRALRHILLFVSLFESIFTLFIHIHHLKALSEPIWTCEK